MTDGGDGSCWATIAETRRIASKLGPVDRAVLDAAAWELEIGRKERIAMKQPGSPSVAQFDLSKVDNLAAREEAMALAVVRNKAHDALLDAEEKDESHLSEEAFRAIRAAYHAAQNAYDDHPLRIYTDYEGEPQRCALSGVPLLATDEVLGDAMTDEMVLRLWVLPPRPTETQDAESEAA